LHQKEKKICAGGKMTYYFVKETDLGFDDAIIRVTEELKKEGFGVLTPKPRSRKSWMRISGTTASWEPVIRRSPIKPCWLSRTSA